MNGGCNDCGHCRIKPKSEPDLLSRETTSLENQLMYLFAQFAFIGLSLSRGKFIFGDEICRERLQKRIHMTHEQLCIRTLTIAKRSFLQGNLPFGCILADANGNILLEAENSVITSNDAIAHCEINLVHAFAGKYDFEFLNTCTVYASTEPCPMCSGAIFFSGVGRIVYALSKERYKEIANDHNPAYHFPVSSKELLSKGGRQVHVEGPALEQEAIEFYTSLFIKS